MIVAQAMTQCIYGAAAYISKKRFPRTQNSRKIFNFLICYSLDKFRKNLFLNTTSNAAFRIFEFQIFFVRFRTHGKKEEEEDKGPFAPSLRRGES